MRRSVVGWAAALGRAALWLSVLFLAPAAAPARSCESLVSLDLSAAADKPAHIVSAKASEPPIRPWIGEAFFTAPKP